MASKIQQSDFSLICKGLGYPESPKYQSDGSILLVEIQAGPINTGDPKGHLSRVDAEGNRHVITEIEGGPNGLAIGPDGHAWIANNGGFHWEEVPLPNKQVLMIGTVQPEGYKGGSVDRVDLQDGSWEVRIREFSQGLSLAGFGPRDPKPVPYEKPLPLRGPDDLVFDKRGGFWVSDWGKQRPRDADVTGIYYVDPDGKTITESIYPLASPNGIALSPEEDRLYTALTYSREILYWDLDKETGQIIPNPASMDGSKLLTAALPGQGILDSMTVDSEGNVYVAVMLPSGMNPLDNGGIAVISPDGELLEFIKIDIPGLVSPLPSSMCFGDEDLKTLYVTCGASGLLVKCRVAIAGHPLNFNSYK